MNELEECERQISEVQIALVEYVSSLSANDLLKILAHKLNMQDKILALVEVRKDNVYPEYRIISKDRYCEAVINIETAIITYGVEK